jgi:hypothetical protein
MGIVTTKRVLTLKSKLGFGKYTDLTIQEIINLGKASYLRWVYFNYENIDFLPEILTTIQIPVEYRLAKPAKKPDVLQEVNDKADEKHKFVYSDSEEAKEKRIKVYNTVKKNKYGLESKASLLRKNHGHR